MSRLTPNRGEVWLVDLGATRGHEQGGVRPSVVVSANRFNRSGAGLALVVPTTTATQRISLRIVINQPEGGVRRTSFIKCEDIRSIASERLIERWGQVSDRTMALVEDRLRALLDL